MRNLSTPLAALAGALLIAAAPVAAQDKAPDTNAQNPAWHAQQQLYLLGLKAEDGWYTAEGGLRWRWLKYLASPEKPKVTDIVTVHYEGKLIDGTVFDSSYARGQPATFPLDRLRRLSSSTMGVGSLGLAILSTT